MFEFPKKIANFQPFLLCNGVETNNPMTVEYVTEGKTFNSESSVRRNILFTGTVKVKHKLPYRTFIHRV